MATMLKQYELQEEIGRGGMATVYRALDTNLDRDVAVKVLASYFGHEPEFAARFAREARTISSLEHSAIVPIYDYGEQDLVPFLVMRLMTGGSLSDHMRRGPLSVAECAIILARICSALDKAHARGIIHRDVKPDNVLFDEDGDAYLADFGIVKIAEGSTTYTQTGGILGTPAYMSPEQAQGSRDIDYRADIYSVGAILYQMLTGKLPYEADTPMGLAVKHIVEPVPQILAVNPGLPAGIQPIINTAMAKQPGDRYASAGALAQAVEELAHESARPTATPESAADDTVKRPDAIPHAEIEPRPPATRPRPGGRSEPTEIVPPPGSLPGRSPTTEADFTAFAQKRASLRRRQQIGIGALGVLAVLIIGALIVWQLGQPAEEPMVEVPVQVVTEVVSEGGETATEVVTEADGNGGAPSTDETGSIEKPVEEPAATSDPMPDFEPLTLTDATCAGAFSEIAALDEHTVRFSLCAPDPAFLSKIAFTAFAIWPSEYLVATGGTGELLERPIGTGPYQIDSWNRGDSIIFSRYEDYWGDPAIADTLVFRWSTEGAQRLLELQSGQVDGIDNPSPDDFDTIRDDSNLELLERPALNIFYFAMTNTFEPFDDPLVRQAVAMGIDRDRIVDNYYPAGSEVASHFTPCAIVNGCEGEEWYEFNPEMARDLLDQAGYPRWLLDHDLLPRRVSQLPAGTGRRGPGPAGPAAAKPEYRDRNRGHGIGCLHLRIRPG